MSRTRLRSHVALRATLALALLYGRAVLARPAGRTGTRRGEGRPLPAGERVPRGARPVGALGLQARPRRTRASGCRGGRASTRRGRSPFRAAGTSRSTAPSTTWARPGTSGQGQVPRGFKGDRVFLRVGSANYGARVWLNGAFVGRARGRPPAVHVRGHGAGGGGPALHARDSRRERAQAHARAGGQPASWPGPFGMFAGNPRTTFDFFPYAGLHRAVPLYSVPAGARRGRDGAHRRSRAKTGSSG